MKECNVSRRVLKSFTFNLTQRFKTERTDEARRSKTAVYIENLSFFIIFKSIWLDIYNVNLKKDKRLSGMIRC